MKSKIIIDITEAGLPIVKITRPKSVVSAIGYDPSSSDDDVRDKLVSRFLGMGSFAVITTDSDNPGDAEIHSMNVLDLLSNINSTIGQLFNPDHKYSPNQFQQAVFKVCEMIESVTNERSTAFINKCVAQEIINGK